MDINTFSGVVTGVLLILYIGIAAWAYSDHTRARFDEAAHLPFSDAADAPGGKR